jgi:hypothetical protein
VRKAALDNLASPLGRFRAAPGGWAATQAGTKKADIKGGLFSLIGRALSGAQLWGAAGPSRFKDERLNFT